MVRVLDHGEPVTTYGVQAVLDNAISEGAPEPSFVVVADAGGHWRSVAAAESRRRRARGLIAAVEDRAFLDAIRLDLGGGLRLPASTRAAVEALTGAAGAPEPAAGFDPADAVQVCEASSNLAIVTVGETRFWRRQLGIRVIGQRLVRLAENLPVPFAVLPWPTVVIASSDTGMLRSQWDEVWADLGPGAPQAEIRLVSAPEDPIELPAAVFEALHQPSDVPDGDPPARTVPVHELPSGRAVGSWCARPGGDPPAAGWLAVPEDPRGLATGWRLHGAGWKGEVVEVRTADEVDAAAGATAVRAPGWAAAEIRLGSPAAVLTARLADTAARLGLPLWVPNVDADVLRYVLRLPGTLWVDGPAVPG